MDDDLMELDQARLNELRDARAKLSEEFVKPKSPIGSGFTNIMAMNFDSVTPSSKP